MDDKTLNVANLHVEPGILVQPRRLDGFSLQQIAHLEYRLRWDGLRLMLERPRRSKKQELRVKDDE